MYAFLYMTRLRNPRRMMREASMPMARVIASAYRAALRAFFRGTKVGNAADARSNNVLMASAIGPVESHPFF